MKYSRGPYIKRRLATIQEEKAWERFRESERRSEARRLASDREIQESIQRASDEKAARRVAIATHIKKQAERPRWKKILRIYV